MVQNFRGIVSVKTIPRRSFMSDENTVELNITNCVGVGEWEAMSLRHHHHQSESLFDCEQDEEELKLVIKYKENKLTLWDAQIIRVNLERKTKILDSYVKKLVESPNLSDDATEKIKEMIIGDSKLVAALTPLVFERLVEILVDDKVNELTKGSAACILGFVKFDECDVGLKEKAIKVLVKLMSDDHDIISIPVLRTLTRFAYLSADCAHFIIENGALEGAVAVVNKPIFPSPKWIQNLAKFVVVVVRRVQVPNDKVGAIVTNLNKILNIEGLANLRCIVRACYILSYISVDRWVNEGNILNNIILLICNKSDMVASSALRVAAYTVKSENSRKTLTKNYNFLQHLGWSEIWSKPKSFPKDACYIISNIATEGGTFIKDLDMYGLMDALFKLLETADYDVRKEAACTIHNVISCHRYELTRKLIDVTVT
ncbi:uncharacterized protein LOC141664479 [Apium graveolens]|uniref:uncharacterized protein LOC141664479 n=1 Tax=Apium graveolens TaxID=4045 RepID=UPI003D7A0D8B